MPNEKMIMDTKLHSINPLHVSNQAKEILASNVKNKPNEPFYFGTNNIAVSRNEVSC